MRNFLSRAEADEICDGLMERYHAEKGVSCVDIDGFVKDVLHCPVFYEAFAEKDLDKIGFCGDGISKLKVYREGKPASVVFPRDTIVLEHFLLRAEEQNRRRFTLAHEAGHVLTNRMGAGQTAHFHRPYDADRVYAIEELKERLSMAEWQANTLAASLLMPRPVMYETLKKFNGGKRLPVYGETVFHPREKVILQKMADALEVSYTALVIRLRGLGLLNHHDISEYIEKELQLGGNTS